MVNSLQKAGKVLSITLNYFEHLHRKAFKIRESLGKLSFICLLGKVLEVAGKVLSISFQIWESF